MSQTLIRPFPKMARSSFYGWRPLAGGTFHEGEDVPVALNTPLPALRSGVVVDVGETKKFGKYATVLADNGLYYRWHAANKILCKIGDRVTEGETIALSGKTGYWSTGYHGHLQTTRGSNPATHFNPNLVLVDSDDPRPSGTSKPSIPEELTIISDEEEDEVMTVLITSPGVGQMTAIPGVGLVQMSPGDVLGLKGIGGPKIQTIEVTAAMYARIQHTASVDPAGRIVFVTGSGYALLEDRRLSVIGKQETVDALASAGVPVVQINDDEFAALSADFR
jgi:hypothetical protein